MFVASRSLPTVHTSLFEQPSKGSSSKQDQINPRRAPVCADGPGVQEYPNSGESRKRRSLPSAWTGPEPGRGAPGKPSDTQQEMAGL